MYKHRESHREKRSLRERDLISEGEEWSNNSVVLNCLLARELISPYLLLLFFSFYISPLRPFNPPSSFSAHVFLSSLHCFDLTLTNDHKKHLTLLNVHKNVEQLQHKQYFSLPIRCHFHFPIFFLSVSLCSRFYCETGVEDLYSWNFYEYWSVGSCGLWEKERGWRRSDGRMDGCMKVAEGVVKKEGGRCSEEGEGEERWRDPCWDAFMGSRVAEWINMKQVQASVSQIIGWSVPVMLFSNVETQLLAPAELAKKL